MIRAIAFRCMKMPAMALAAAGLALAATPAQAQFSQGYRFLEAVKKKDGQKVEDAINEPGSTIINTRDVSTGQSALHIVTARRDLTWMSYLLAKGANVNARDGKGQTALQLAINFGFTEGVQLLVDRKADLNESNDAGETPLISAVHRRDLAMLRILLKAGADPDRADNSGRSARDYAALEGRTGPLLGEIESSTKAREQRAKAKGTYGPTF